MPGYYCCSSTISVHTSSVFFCCTPNTEKPSCRCHPVAGHKSKFPNSQLQHTSKPLLWCLTTKSHALLPKHFTEGVKSPNCENAHSHSPRQGKTNAVMLRVKQERTLKKGITYLTRIKVRPGQKIFEVDVALWLSLFQHDHGIRLSQQRPGSTQLSELDQLQHNLHPDTNVCTSKR